jgi:hypothetical protein
LKGTSRHTCILAAMGLLGAGCIPDLPPNRSTDLPPVDGGSLPDARGPLDAGADAPTFETEAGPGCGDGYIDLEAGEQCDPPSPADAVLAVCSSTCRMQCPTGGFVWSGNNHCYWPPGTATSLDPLAVNECNPALGSGHVVTFASEAEFEAVEQGLHLVHGDPPFWVGMMSSDDRSYLSLVGYEPGWAPTCPGCYVHAADPKADLPRYVDADGGISSQFCVGASTDGLDPNWRQRPCTNVKTRVVCEREPIGLQFEPCEAGICGDLVATRAAKRYVLVTQPATADAAAQACAVLGGRLVVLQSRDEREQLWLQLSRSAPQVFRVWIGLSQSDAGPEDDSGAASWVWDDGTQADVPGAYASAWGDRMPAIPGTTSRAYLRAFTGEIDDTLARNDEPAQTIGTMPFVCELPVVHGP